MSFFIIGIDPGASGAIALIDARHVRAPRVVFIYDMPVVEVVMKTTGTKRERVNVDGVLSAIRVLCGSALTPVEGLPEVWIEDVHGMRGDGAVGAFTFGRAAGIVETAARACGLPVHFVAPGAWKAALACPANKTKARKRASELFIGCSLWPCAKDDGRAEAAMIALYGARQGLKSKPINW